MTIQCCRCKKVQRDGDWASPMDDSDGFVSHSYCPVCLEVSRLEIKAELARANAAERRLPIVASTIRLRGI